MTDSKQKIFSAEEASLMLREAADWLRANAPEVLRACMRLTEYAKDAERYRVVRRKVAIIGTGDGGAEFVILNLPRPRSVAPDAGSEFDAVLLESAA